MVKFVLNEYHRNISDEEFIEDVIETAKILNKANVCYNIITGKAPAAMMQKAASI